MTIKEHHIKTGICYTLIMLTIALIFAIVIFECLIVIPDGGILHNTRSLFSENGISLTATVLIMYSISFWFGRQSVIQIIELNKKAVIVGIRTGMTIFFLSLLIGATINLIEQSFRYQVFTESDFLFDYWLNPVFTIGLFGILPAFLISLGFGKILSKKIKT